MMRVWLAVAFLAGSGLPLMAETVPQYAARLQFAAAASGLALARQTCAECHGVERGRRSSPNAEAPAFQLIADTPGMSALALRAFLYTPHRMMPNIVLTREEADEVIDYILSLQ